MLKKILIAARNDNIASLFTELSCEIFSVSDGYKIRAMDLSDFDLVIVSTPLSDEFGLDLVADIRGRTSAPIIVLTKSELQDEIQLKLRFTGAYVIGRPVSKQVLVQSVKLVAVAQNNIQRLEAKNTELTDKIDEMKIIARAKLCLVEYLKLTEEQAHKHIQKQAMDLRISLKSVAERIIKTYLNKI